MEESLPHLQQSFDAPPQFDGRPFESTHRTRAFVPRPDFRPPCAGKPVVLRGTVATVRSHGGNFPEKTMGAIASLIPSLLGGVTGGGGADATGGALTTGVGGVVNKLSGGLLSTIGNGIASLFGG
jgi:hypothetical protein